jgi:hypothetical protein
MTESAAPRTTREYGARFWIGLAIGWAFIGFGIHSAYHTSGSSRPVYSVTLLIVFALLHDLIVAPVVILLGLAARRVLRGGIITRTAVGALVISAIICFEAWPVLGSYGREPSLASSLLTNDYVSGLLTVLGVVWGAAAVVAAVRIVRARRGPAAGIRPPRVSLRTGR